MPCPSNKHHYEFVYLISFKDKIEVIWVALENINHYHETPLNTFFVLHNQTTLLWCQVYSKYKEDTNQ